MYVKMVHQACSFFTATYFASYFIPDALFGSFQRERCYKLKYFHYLDPDGKACGELLHPSFYEIIVGCNIIDI